MYDLTICTRSEPFTALLCGGMWSVFTARLRQGPSSCYCPEIATVPAGLLETHGPPIATVCASDLWGFCACRVSDARLRRAGTRAERGLAPRLAPGTCLPAPRLGKWVPKRQATGPPHTRQPPPHPVREPPDTMCSPPASGGRPLFDTSQKLPQRQRGPQDPSPSHWYSMCLPYQSVWPARCRHGGRSRLRRACRVKGRVTCLGDQSRL